MSPRIISVKTEGILNFFLILLFITNYFESATSKPTSIRSATLNSIVSGTIHHKNLSIEQRNKQNISDPKYHDKHNISKRVLEEYTTQENKREKRSNNGLFSPLPSIKQIEKDVNKKNFLHNVEDEVTSLFSFNKNNKLNDFKSQNPSKNDSVLLDNLKSPLNKTNDFAIKSLNNINNYTMKNTTENYSINEENLLKNNINKINEMKNNSETTLNNKDFNIDTTNSGENITISSNGTNTLFKKSESNVTILSLDENEIKFSKTNSNLTANEKITSGNLNILNKTTDSKIPLKGNETMNENVALHNKLGYQHIQTIKMKYNETNGNPLIENNTRKNLNSSVSYSKNNLIYANLQQQKKSTDNYTSNRTFKGEQPVHSDSQNILPVGDKLNNNGTEESKGFHKNLIVGSLNNSLSTPSKITNGTHNLGVLENLSNLNSFLKVPKKISSEQTDSSKIEALTNEANRTEILNENSQMKSGNISSPPIVEAIDSFPNESPPSIRKNGTIVKADLPGVQNISSVGNRSNSIGGTVHSPGFLATKLVANKGNNAKSNKTGEKSSLFNANLQEVLGNTVAVNKKASNNLPKQNNNIIAVTNKNEADSRTGPLLKKNASTILEKSNIELPEETSSTIKISTGNSLTNSAINPGKSKNSTHNGVYQGKVSNELKESSTKLDGFGEKQDNQNTKPGIEEKGSNSFSTMSNIEVTSKGMSTKIVGTGSEINSTGTATKILQNTPEQEAPNILSINQTKEVPKSENQIAESFDPSGGNLGTKAEKPKKKGDNLLDIPYTNDVSDEIENIPYSNNVDSEDNGGSNDEIFVMTQTAASISTTGKYVEITTKHSQKITTKDNTPHSSSKITDVTETTTKDEESTSKSSSAPSSSTKIALSSQEPSNEEQSKTKSSIIDVSPHLIDPNLSKESNNSASSTSTKIAAISKETTNEGQSTTKSSIIDVPPYLIDPKLTENDNKRVTSSPQKTDKDDALENLSKTTTSSSNNENSTEKIECENGNTLGGILGTALQYGAIGGSAGAVGAMLPQILNLIKDLLNKNGDDNNKDDKDKSEDKQNENQQENTDSQDFLDKELTQVEDEIDNKIEDIQNSVMDNINDKLTEVEDGILGDIKDQILQGDGTILQNVKSAFTNGDKNIFKSVKGRLVEASENLVGDVKSAINDDEDLKLVKELFHKESLDINQKRENLLDNNLRTNVQMLFINEKAKTRRISWPATRNDYLGKVQTIENAEKASIQGTNDTSTSNYSKENGEIASNQEGSIPEVVTKTPNFFNAFKKFMK